MHTKIGKPSFSRYASGSHQDADISLDRAITSSPQTLSIVNSPFSSKRNSHSSAISSFSRDSSAALSMPPIIDYEKSPLCTSAPFQFATIPHNSSSPHKNSFPVLQSPSPHTPLHHNLKRESCAFCKELLLANFPGEATITLSCSHHSHGQCFKLLGGDSQEQHGALICNLCNRATGIHRGTASQPPTVIKKLPELNLNAAFPSIDGMCPLESDTLAANPKTPLDQIIPDTLAKPPHKSSFGTENAKPATMGPQPNDSASHLLSPIDEGSFKCSSLSSQDDMLIPRVSFTTDVMDVNRGVTCLLTVKPSAAFQRPWMGDEEADFTQRLAECFRSRLTQVSNWQASIGFGGLGDLCIVDSLNVSTNGYNWDQLCCFCFEKGLLILDNNTNTLIGQIIYKQDSTGVDRSKDTITFTLTNDSAPTLRIQHWQPTIITKWWYYLKKLTVAQEKPLIPLSHLSANCWQLVSDTELHHQLPSSVIQLQELMQQSAVMGAPSSLLSQATPEPEPLPLTLVVSVCLINNNINPTISNESYKQTLITIINRIRASLRPQDKLGLIQVGLGGSGSQKGTFTGCIGADWSGWDGILQLLEIIPNRNYNCRPILANALDEFLVAFKKCKALSPFLPNDVHSNNRFVIIQANNYDVDTTPDLEEFMSLQGKGKPLASFNRSHNLCVLKYLNDTVQFLRQSTSLSSIDIIRAGPNYTSEVLAVHKVISNTTHSLSDTELNVTLGDRLLRFNSLNEFVDEGLAELVENYQRICIPKVVIDLSTQQFVRFEEIEVNGGKLSLHNSNVRNISITINGLSPGADRNILMKLNLDETKTTELANIPMVGYRLQWLDRLDSEKVLSSRVSQLYDESSKTRDVFCLGLDSANADTASTTFAAQFAMLTPPQSENDDLPYDNIPLLPPLESTGDKILTRRQIELEVIESLGRINDSISASSNQKIITDTLAAVEELMRRSNANIELVHKQPDACRQMVSYHSRHFQGHREHMAYITNELRYLCTLFEDNEHLESAIAQCRDFASSLV